jgi:tetratricopeptide (TPR) repeat protein
MGQNRQALEERYRKAVEQKNSGQYDAAIPELEELAGLDPEWPELHLTLGLTYGFVGRFDESVAAIRRAVELDPGSVDARLDLAKTFAMLGDYDQARREFEAVLDLKPDHMEAKKQLSYFPPPGAPTGLDEAAGEPGEPGTDDSEPAESES